jgi:hypothetical protein
MDPTLEPVDVALTGLRCERSDNFCRLVPWVRVSMVGQIPKALPAVIDVVHLPLPTHFTPNICGTDPSFQEVAEKSPSGGLTAEGLLKYTFAALLKAREEDLAFFDQRIEKGLVAKLEGIVGSQFVHMDYGEAIRVLERANEKFEFPVKWGIDLQSEHERYLTEKHAKKSVIVMNYPTDIKAFYVRVNDDGRTVAAIDVLAPGDRRDHRRQPARGAALSAELRHARIQPISSSRSSAAGK